MPGLPWTHDLFPAATGTPSASASPTLTRAIAECGVEIPEETAGPYPGDGSNGPNVLAASGVVRRDITSSFGTSSTRAGGVPLTVTLTLLDNANGCGPLASDNVFGGDGGIYQLATMSGSVSGGYAAGLNVTV